MSSLTTSSRRAGVDCAGCHQYVDPTGTARPHNRTQCLATCINHASGSEASLVAARRHGYLGRTEIGRCPHFTMPDEYDGFDATTGSFTSAGGAGSLFAPAGGSALGSALSRPLRPSDSASQIGSFFDSSGSGLSLAAQQARAYIDAHPTYRFASESMKQQAVAAYEASRSVAPDRALQQAISRPLPPSTVAPSAAVPAGGLPGAAVPTLPPPPPPPVRLTHNVEIGSITLRQNTTNFTMVHRTAYSRADIQTAVTAAGFGNVLSLAYLLFDFLPSTLPFGWRLVAKVGTGALPAAPTDINAFAALPGQDIVINQNTTVPPRVDFTPPLDLTQSLFVAAYVEVGAGLTSANAAFVRFSLRIGANV